MSLSTGATLDGRNIVLTGVPRSGTTLSCHLLCQADDTVALCEPMQVHLLEADDRAMAVGQVRDFFAQSRTSLLETGMAYSRHLGGKVPDNPFAQERAGRDKRAFVLEQGMVHFDKPLTAGLTLAVKHTAAFTALLPELAAEFDTVAIVRNPLASLASWHSLDIPISQGRLPMGERLDPKLQARLASEPDRLERQLCILDWFFSSYRLYLPEGHVVRYEDMVAAGGADVLGRATGVALPPQSLQSRNRSPLYDPDLYPLLAERMCRRGGAWSALYPDQALWELVEAMKVRS